MDVTIFCRRPPPPSPPLFCHCSARVLLVEGAGQGFKQLQSVFIMGGM
jgi:hypothetical protein